MAEMISVDAVNSDAGVLLMIDSGACMSTCPRLWCSWSPTKPITDTPKAVTATGSPLTVYGVRRARCRSWHGLEFELEFIVSNVTRPIVAMCSFLELGLVPRFESPSCLVKGERMPLIAAGPLFYLP
eukprot:10434192-Heterocapsa_arctica.AAC.1